MVTNDGGVPLVFEKRGQCELVTFLVLKQEPCLMAERCVCSLKASDMRPPMKAECEGRCRRGFCVNISPDASRRAVDGAVSLMHHAHVM